MIRITRLVVRFPPFAENNPEKLLQRSGRIAHRLHRNPLPTLHVEMVNILSEVINLSFFNAFYTVWEDARYGVSSYL